MRQGGTVRIGGQDVRSLTLDSLRGALGQVPQEPVLFNDTIFYNIKYGNLNASEVEVHDAARQVCDAHTCMVAHCTVHVCLRDSNNSDFDVVYSMYRQPFTIKY